MQVISLSDKLIHSFDICFQFRTGYSIRVQECEMYFIMNEMIIKNTKIACY